MTLPHLVLLSLIVVMAVPASLASAPLRVAIYADEGAMEPFISKAEDAATAAGMTVSRVKAKDIASGGLGKQDVIVFPGGTGSGQARSLGEQASRSVRTFVADGGGVIGVCAGGYLLAEGYSEETSRLELINARLWDLRNWARGEGVVDIQPSGKPDAPPIPIRFENAPVFEPGAKGLHLVPYVPLATFITDVGDVAEGRGSIAGHDAIIASTYGEGRVVLFGPHPELTPGLEPMFQSALMWAAGHGEEMPSWENVLAGTGRLDGEALTEPRNEGTQ